MKRDLWAEAYKGLEDEDKTRLRKLKFAEDGTVRIVDHVETPGVDEAKAEQIMTSTDIQNVFANAEASIDNIKALEGDKTSSNVSWISY